jgi:phenylacetaldehyde dehydrogenase
MDRPARRARPPADAERLRAVVHAAGRADLAGRLEPADLGERAAVPGRFLRDAPQQVTGFLESGVSEGATTVTGGGRFGDQGYSVEPTVMTNTRPDMKIVREEIFGPVVVAEPFRSLDEIAAEANNTSYGLGAGIWTKDISKAHALAKKLRAGTVWINCYNVFDASLPFGGYKQSGWGREMGHEVLEAYTEVKAVTTQL